MSPYELRQTKKTRQFKRDIDHDVFSRMSLNELADLYPGMSMRKLRALKKIQDDTILPSYDLLDITELKCSRKKKSKLYELFIRQENEVQFSDEYFAFQNEINEHFKKFKNPGETLKSRILKLETNETNRAALLRKYKQLKSLDDPTEKSSVEHWLNEAMKLPHDKLVHSGINDSNIQEFLTSAKEILDSEVYGLNDVKKSILRYLCIRCLNPDTHAQNLALCGPPGVGKTAIAKAVSKILQLPFYQISLGGVTNAEFLKGFESTYVSSKCGQIARALQFMQCKNGIIFFDEFDKIDQNRDVTSALLHITDPQQNNQFCDVYFDDLFIDLSSIWFIFSMNELPDNKPLVDRLNVINIREYAESEKKEIVTHFIIPKLLRQFDLSNDVSFNASSVDHILRECGSMNSIRPIIGIITTFIEKLYVYKKTKLLIDVPLSFPLTVDDSLLQKLLVKNAHLGVQDSVRHLYI